MELSVRGADRSVEVRPHRVLVDAVSRFRQLVGQQVHQVLHQVALCHQQVLANVSTVTFELVLREEDVKQLLISLLMGLLNPLFELVDV